MIRIVKFAITSISVIPKILFENRSFFFFFFLMQQHFLSSKEKKYSGYNTAVEICKHVEK